MEILTYGGLYSIIERMIDTIIWYLEDPQSKKIIQADSEHYYLTEIIEHNKLILHRFVKNSSEHTLFLLKYSNHIEPGIME